MPTIAMLTRVLPSLFMLCFQATAIAQPQPSFQDVQTWWRTSHTELINVGKRKIGPEDIELDETDGKPAEIHLMNHETAFLYPVYINPRGRNDWTHVVMVRPEKKEVREMPDPVKEISAVYDLNHDGISEVVCSTSASGQGAMEGEKTLVQFNDWNPVVIYKSVFTENEGAYGKQSKRYHARRLSWTFTDLDQDGVLDFIEEVTLEEGRNHRSPRSAKAQQKFLFKDGRMVKYSEYKRSHTSPQKPGRP